MKCIVLHCDNHSDQGNFVGNLCVPCHTFITTGEGEYSQVYRNAMAMTIAGRLSDSFQQPHIVFTTNGKERFRF